MELDVRLGSHVRIFLKISKRDQTSPGTAREAGGTPKAGSSLRSNADRGVGR